MQESLADSALMAETLALKDGIGLVIEKKWQRVVLEIDSRELQYVFSNKCKLIDWKIRPLVIDIQRMSRIVPNWRLRVVRRTANAAANSIAVQTKVIMCMSD